ncbi:MAG: LapA family protein [Oscillochloridaceae bacterium umkhey_bin13]
MKMISRTILGIILAALAVVLVIFSAQNNQNVEIVFLSFKSGEISLPLLVIGAIIFGAALMWLIGLFSAAQRSYKLNRATKDRMQLASRNVQLENRIKALEQELSLVYPDRRPGESKQVSKPPTK